MKKLGIVGLALCLIVYSSCVGKKMFDDKYVTGYIATTAKFGEYGMIELRNGDHHQNSFLALYHVESVDSTAEVGKKYLVKVKKYKGIPKVVKIIDGNTSGVDIYGAFPRTSLDFHILSDHGDDANWHKKGHRILGGYKVNSSIGLDSLLIVNEDGDSVYYAVPVEDTIMARAISRDIINEDIYYELDTSKVKTFMGLDTVHRHGDQKYKW